MMIGIETVQLLLELMKEGLTHGAGQGKMFCVQQAVNRAVNRIGSGYHNDMIEDHAFCLNQEVRNLGITMNDSGFWLDKQDRAEGLKRFAVAELGSSEIPPNLFSDGMEQEGYWMDELCFNSREEVIQTADAAVRVLTRLGTEGSKFLYILDEPNKRKAKKEAKKLGNQIWAAQLADQKQYDPNSTTKEAKKLQ